MGLPSTSTKALWVLCGHVSEVTPSRAPSVLGSCLMAQTTYPQKNLTQFHISEIRLYFNLNPHPRICLLILEGEEDRVTEKEREGLWFVCLMQVPLPRIEPPTFWCIGQCYHQLSTKPGQALILEKSECNYTKRNHEKEIKPLNPTTQKWQPWGNPKRCWWRRKPRQWSQGRSQWRHRGAAALETVRSFPKWLNILFSKDLLISTPTP